MKILGIVLCGCVLQVQMFAAAASGFAVPGVVRPVPRGLEGLLNVVNQCDSVAFKNILKNPREFLGLGDSQKSSLMEAIAGQQLAIKQIRKEILDVWATEGRSLPPGEGVSLDISAWINELALLVTTCQWERFVIRLADARIAGLNYSLFAYVVRLFEEREAGIAQIDTYLKQVCALPGEPHSGSDDERRGGGGESIRLPRDLDEDYFVVGRPPLEAPGDDDVVALSDMLAGAAIGAARASASTRDCSGGGAGYGCDGGAAAGAAAAGPRYERDSHKRVYYNAAGERFEYRGTELSEADQMAWAMTESLKAIPGGASGRASLPLATRAELDAVTLVQCQWALFECIQQSKDDSTAVEAVSAFIGDRRNLYPYMNQILTEPLPEITNYRGSLIDYVRQNPDFTGLARKLETLSRFMFPRNQRLTELLAAGK